MFAVQAKGLEKRFARGGHRVTLFGALRTLTRGGPSPADRRPALTGIDLEIAPGEMVAVIGSNGSGKTTLLKTIAGIYAPSAGEIRLHGRATLLAGLGAGMIDELTVTDNVRLYGAVLGIRRRRLDANLDAILRWAELEDFPASELRTLSMGMRTRLAFAITTFIESETVLMDEAFSAGDARFQAKCDRFFLDSRAGGRTFVIATHNLDFVRRFCDRALWLHEGRQRALGATREVVDAYVGSRER